jgi:hypothetical protein
MRRAALVLIGFLAIAGLIGYAAVGGSDDSDAGGTAREVGATGAFGATGSTGGEAAGAVAAADGLDAAGPASEEGGGGVSGLEVLPQLGTDVVKTAQIAIEVRTDGFEGAFDAVSLLSGRYGGYVQSSSTAGTKVRSGTLLLRVPANRFDEAMSDLRDLGSVEGESVSSEDVSAQFVDLEARLRAWQAQEAVLLDLMGRATSIEATIRVQSELQDVQFRIEQIKGQLRLLEDRTAFSTIQVTLREPGAPVTPSRAERERPSLGQAWDRAVDGFLGVFYVVVVGLGYLVPIAAFAALGWLAYRRAARPGGSATPAS